jgi:GntR family transcriptional regulator
MLQDEQYVEKQRGKGLFVKSGAPHSMLEKERTPFVSTEWPLILQQISRLKLSVEELPRNNKENQ